MENTQQIMQQPFRYDSRGAVEDINSDLTVVGGGLAGCVAAIAAARLGLRVALVNDRPVLGGNSSSEIRVWICGAMGGRNSRYARETGIVGELLTENKFRNPEGNPYLWDLVLLDFVKREPNIRLFLNTHVHDVEMREKDEISAAIGRQLASERIYRFESPLFVDASGDGVVGYLSGADYRVGREARDEFGESLAPEKADAVTLGSTLLFYGKDVGKPVKFVPPSFAYTIEEMEDILSRRPGYRPSERAWGCHYWWFEYGGLLDTIKDNEEIADELRRLVYGAWNYIKNSGRFNADTLTLEWVGNIPGKRESRRFLGDYILTQNDLAEQRRFPDAVCYGGWSIDVHPPEGFRSSEPGCTQIHTNGIYDIPFRCLYSRNIENLMFAGRNISATHVAFASTRVMATCGLMGQAVGTAAYVCQKHGIRPNEVYPRHIDELRGLLLENDSYIIGLANTDERDVARRSRVTASSYRKAEPLESSGVLKLDKDIYQLFPVTEGRLDKLSVVLDAQAPTELEVEIYETDRPENYIPGKRLGTARALAQARVCQWVDLEFGLDVDKGRSLFAKFVRNEAISLHTSDERPVGIVAFQKVETQVSSYGGDIAGYHMRPIGNICFRITPEQGAYRPESVINGYSRPYGLPNLWVSGEMSGDGEWLQLDFPERTRVSEICLYFNADLNSPLNNLMPASSNVFPETVRDYSVFLNCDGGFKKLFEVQGNYQRFRRHILPEPVEGDGLRIVFTATNGSRYAQVFEVRVIMGQR